MRDTTEADSARRSMSAHGEREFKFVVAAGFVLPPLGDDSTPVAPLPPLLLDAYYWDTADLRLTRWGHTLRYRTSADEDRWTVKLGEGRRGDMLIRREVSCTAPPTSPPAELVGVVAGLLGGQPLVPTRHIRTRRNRSVLTDRSGRHLVAVDDDRVEVVDAGRVVGAFHEIELELLDDEGAAALDVAVRALRRAGAASADPTAKLRRALGPLSAAPPLPQTTLRDATTVEQLAQHVLARGLQRLLERDPAVRVDLRGESVHQARVAARRLRSDLRTIRPLLDRAAVDPLRAELKWAGTVLGAVRDLDVLDDLLVRTAGGTGTSLASLLFELHRQQTEARDQLAAALASERWASLLARLEQAALLPPLAPDVAPRDRARSGSTRLLRRTWKRLERRVRDGDARADAASTAHWHDIRKSAKSVRYAAELLDPLVKDRGRELAKRAQAIQTALGAYRDAETACEWLAVHAPASEDVRALTDALARRAADQRASWPKLWRKARRAADRI